MSPAALINTPLPVAQVFKPAELPPGNSDALRTKSPRYSRLESLRYSSSRSQSLHKL
jgi:hypothetical protein